jgi:hypothetical protein
MMNVPFFVLNIVIMCAMLTFAPAIAFALANTTGVKGQPFWPLILPSGLK